MCAFLAHMLPRKCWVQKERALFPYAVGQRVAKRSAYKEKGVSGEGMTLVLAENSFSCSSRLQGL
jgi:hypothetical protein